jgi:colanic acid biosynthesis glycosyl transferase WcaI
VIENSFHWLILSQYYPPEVGAPQIRLHSMARELCRNGIQVQVQTAMPNYPVGKTFPAYSGKWQMREKIDGITVRRSWVFAGTGKSALIRLANYLSFTLTSLIAVLFGSRPKILFVESQPLSLGIIAILMKWLRNVPYIWNVPDLQIDVARQLGFIQSETLLKAAWHLENLLMRNAWKVSTVTKSFIDHIESRGIPRKQITFLPNGADADFLKPVPSCQELLERWGLQGKKVFLYVGTHGYYHGLNTLIEAAAMLKERDDLAFLLIGDGPERTSLRNMVARLKLKNVVFGESPYSEMDRLYSIAYASIATLRKMNVANGMRLSKPFPSLSCGVPVIYAGDGEAAELLLQKECGVKVAPENPAALAEAIQQIASNPEERRKMGEAGRRLIEQEYNWPEIVRRWLFQLQDQSNLLPDTSVESPSTDRKTLLNAEMESTAAAAQSKSEV